MELSNSRKRSIELLHCAEYQEPFWKAFLVIGVILLINIAQFLADGYFINAMNFRTRPKLYKALKEKMYEKAAELDLSCYDNPKYYNEFVLAVAICWRNPSKRKYSIYPGDTLKQSFHKKR